MAQSIAMLFLARIVDGLSGGNISTARAYVADITEPEDRARAYGILGAAFGLGFIFGPALSGVLVRVSYTAPIWAAAAITLVATVMAWLWLPETVHRVHAGTGNPLRYLPELLRRPRAPANPGDRLRVLVRARDLSDDVRAVRRAHVSGSTPAQTGYFFAGVRPARRDRAGRVHPADRAARLGDKTTFIVGPGVSARSGWSPRASRIRCRCSR